MFFNASGYRQNIRVENDVLRGEPDLFDKQTVGAAADLLSAFKVVSLPSLVEGHYHHRCSVTPDTARLFEKFRLSFLEGY